MTPVLDAVQNMTATLDKLTIAVTNGNGATAYHGRPAGPVSRPWRRSTRPARANPSPDGRVESMAQVAVSSLQPTTRGKVVCPLCDQAGWGPHWWERHREMPHVRCSTCRRWFTERGIKRHMTVMHP